MSVAEASPLPAKHSFALKREIGLIGLMWASVGSIIGSGWLFGAQKGLIAAGPAAMISWVVGGLMMMVLALIHAELGGMYPVSGGTARFPHYAFGGAAGASFGWFSWLQAATVAPIEVSAMITYAQHWSFAHSWLNAQTEVLTTSGFVVAVLLMALLTAINFLGIRLLSLTNSVATWWKVAVPLLVILVLSFSSFHSGNFTAANGFSPDGLHGILAAISTSGIIFSYLGFEQADQLAGEAKNPKRDLPFAIIGAMIIGIVIYVGLQVAFLLALPDGAIGKTWAAQGNGLYTMFTGPFAEVATLVGLGWLAWIVYADAVISPRHRPDLHHRQLPGFLRALAQRIRADPLRVGQPARGAVGRADRRLRRRMHLLLAVPELAVARRADHERQCADVRRRPAFTRRLPQAHAGRGPALQAAGSGIHGAVRVCHLGPGDLVVGLGHRLEAGRRHPHRLRHLGGQSRVQSQR